MNTVFVLGAGFSKRHGGPLLREMLDLSLPANRKAVGPLWKRPEFKTVWKVLKGLPKAERDIEGVFNRVSNASFYGSKIGNYNARTLIDFLTLYIAQLIEVRTTQRHEPYFDSVYRQFTEIVLSDEPSAIITFNYDLIGENLLMNGHGGLHYGFPSTSKFRYNRLRNARKGPILLKLHGSLDWVICSVCKTIWLNDRSARDKHGNSCLRPDCIGKLRLLIVPPLWNKEPAAKQVDLLWKTARQVLGWADAVEVIGCSFPSTDQLAFGLVREALSSRSTTTISVHNGPRYDYAGLESRLGRKLSKTGYTLEEFVES